MSGIFNILWFVLVGWWSAFLLFVFSFIFALTIVGIPIAKSLYQLAKLNAAPFGKEIIRETSLKGSRNVSGIRKLGGLIINIIWFPVGIALTILYIIEGILACVTIVGIPVGILYIKMGKFLLFPIGAKVVSK